MQFGSAFRRILKWVIADNPRLGSIHIIKVDLADTYMRLWVRMEVVLSAAFLIQNKKTSNQ